MHANVIRYFSFHNSSLHRFYLLHYTIFTSASLFYSFSHIASMKILIAYGTLSGNTQTVAESLGQHLTSAGHTVTVHSQDDVKPDSMNEYEFVFLGGSTWGDGESNPSTQNFMQDVQASTVTFPTVKFAIFGLGETNYAQFCAVTTHLEDMLKAKGATPVCESLKIDGYPDDTILQTTHTWADAALTKMSA